MSDSIIHYRGYTARIEYSDEDKILVGYVLGLKNSIIDFHAHSIEDVDKEFHETIDFYIDTCRKRNRTPEYPSAIDLHLDLPSDVQDRLYEEAEMAGVSVGDIVTQTLRAAYPKTKPQKTRRPQSPRSPAAKRGKRGSSAS